MCLRTILVDFIEACLDGLDGFVGISFGKRQLFNLGTLIGFDLGWKWMEFVCLSNIEMGLSMRVGI